MLQAKTVGLSVRRKKLRWIIFSSGASGWANVLAGYGVQMGTNLFQQVFLQQRVFVPRFTSLAIFPPFFDRFDVGQHEFVLTISMSRTGSTVPVTCMMSGLQNNARHARWHPLRDVALKICYPNLRRATSLSRGRRYPRIQSSSG